MKAKVITLRVVGLFIALGLGALQENWKIDINYILDLNVHIPNYGALNIDERQTALKACHTYMPYDYYFNHKNNRWLLALEIPTLQKLKWALTIGFAGLFFGLNYLILKSFQPSRLTMKIVLWGYPIAFFSAAAIYLIGKNSGMENSSYAVSREIVGGLQSLIPTMIMLPIVWFQKQAPIHE